MILLDFRSLTILVALIISSLASGVEEPQAPIIEVLIWQAQGKQPDEVRALFAERLGPPDRNVGSGIRIEQWDVDGGVLTFHPVTGPTFDRAGVQSRLIRTNNPAARCLFGSYEMVTLPMGPNETRFWLGNVALSTDSSYSFTDSLQNLEQRTAQHDNFFMLYPEGAIEAQYASGVTAETRLEDLPDGSPVAIVTFRTNDRRLSVKYRLLAYRTSMSLAFEIEKSSFRLFKGWVNYWQ
jgi:hypothetical protein